jgi:hypothetical protein
MKLTAGISKEKVKEAYDKEKNAKVYDTIFCLDNFSDEKHIFGKSIFALITKKKLILDRR